MFLVALGETITHGVIISTLHTKFDLNRSPKSLRKKTNVALN